MNRLLAGLAIAITATAAVTVVNVSTKPIDRYIDIGAVGPLRSVDELSATADVVVLVHHAGVQREHWTSEDNREWTAGAGSGKVPLIVRDEVVTVLRAWKGASPGDELTVRGIGGTADGVHLHFDGMDELRAGGTYLLFLQRVDWPTRDGFDKGVLTPVAHGQGVFSQGAQGLENAASTEITSLDQVVATE
jgi:hypothetical protein